LDLAVAAQGNAGAGFGFFGQAVEEAGQHIVHAHVVGGVLVGEQLGEGGQAGAEHAGSGKGRVGLEGGEGGDIDDDARLLLDHGGRDQARGAHGVQEIHLHALVPVFVAQVKYGRARAVAGAVHQHVDAAPFLEGGVDKRLDVVVGLVGAGNADAA